MRPIPIGSRRVVHRAGGLGLAHSASDSAGRRWAERARIAGYRVQ